MTFFILLTTAALMCLVGAIALAAKSLNEFKTADPKSCYYETQLELAVILLLAAIAVLGMFALAQYHAIRFLLQ